MKFVNINKLNDLHDDFERNAGKEQDFQRFVEASMDRGKSICLDAEEVKEVLEKICDDDYNYLLECDDDDFEFWKHDYLKRINFFDRLLGVKEELTIQEINESRKPLKVDMEKES